MYVFIPTNISKTSFPLFLSNFLPTFICSCNIYLSINLSIYQLS